MYNIYSKARCCQKILMIAKIILDLLILDQISIGAWSDICSAWAPLFYSHKGYLLTSSSVVMNLRIYIVFLVI